ncbi:hypothetical protein JL721_8235 [Aureococcus anophagefferens]|nr:hypothetical protein JL721_8235 [Aureococcus anophagefferens]
MAKDKASTRKPRRRNARARDDGGTRRATEATPPVRASKRLSVQLLIQFVVLPRKMGTGRDSLEVRDPRPGPLAARAAPGSGGSDDRARVPAQTDENVVTCFIDGAATLKRARKQGLLRPVAPRPLNARVARRRRRFRTTSIAVARAGAPVTGRSSFRDPSESIPGDLDPVARRLQFDFVLMLCRRLGVKDVFLFATEAGAPAWLTLGFEHVGSSASLIHLRFDLLFKRDRGALNIEGEAFGDDESSAVQERVAEYGEKQVVRLAKEAANAAAEAEAENDDEVPAAASTDAAPPAPAPRRRAAASKKRVVDDADADDEDEAWEPGRPSMMDLDDDEQEQAAKAKRKLKRRSKKKSAKAKNAAGAAPHAPVSAPPAARRRAAQPSATIAPAAQPLSEVQKARLRMKDQEHIRRAARLHEAVTQEQERNAFLERIQAEEVRREQARIAAARPVPPPPNRATGAGDDSDEGWEESDEDDPVEDLIHRERIRERDLRTPGCLALGRKAFRLEDMPRVTERDREILRRVLYILREAERRLQRLFPNLDFRLSWSVRFNVVVQTIDAIALDSNLELTRVDMEVRRSTVGVYEDSLACQLLGQTYYVHPDKTIKITVDLVVTSEVIGAFSVRDAVVPRARSLDDGHLIVELKYLQAMHVKNRMLKKCCYTLYLVELADRLRAEASRETLKTARKNVVEVRSRVRERAPTRPRLRHGRARARRSRVIRKFANAIARKAAEARGETFVPTPYDETAVDAVVVTAVPPVAPVVAPEPAPPAVSAPAGPPLKALEGMDKKECNAELDAAGVPKAGRPKAASEILRDLVRRLRAGEPAASLKATLVADGAKKVVFQYGRPGNGTDYLVARWRGLAETDPLRLEFDELARRDVAAARPTSCPWTGCSACPTPAS